MKNILIMLFFFSCSPSRVQVGSGLNSSSLENQSTGSLSVPLVEIGDSFDIYLIPGSVVFGPNPVPGKNYYLGSGQVSTVNGTLSESTVRELLTKACGTSCSVIDLESISGNPNLWSYQLNIPSVEEFTLTIPSGVGSVEKPSVKTEKSTSSKFIYAGENSTVSQNYYSFIPGQGEYSAGTITIPLGTSPFDLTVNLQDLQDLQPPAGCEGLQFSERIINGQQVLLASLKFLSQSQVCYLSIPTGEISATSDGQNFINNNGQLVMSFNGVSVIETSPVVTPSSFTISMIPSTVNNNMSLVQVLSPYTISASTFVNGLTFSGCTGSLTSSSSLQTQFTLSVQFSGNNLCFITMPAGVVTFNGMINNAGSLALMPLTQTQVVETTNITNIVNNYITNNNIYSPQYNPVISGSYVGYQISLPGEMSVGDVKDLLTISSGCLDVKVEFISTQSMRSTKDRKLARYEGKSEATEEKVTTEKSPRMLAKYAAGATGPTILSNYQITATEKPGETCVVTLPSMNINNVIITPPPPIVCPGPIKPTVGVRTDIVINGTQLEIYDTKSPDCDKFLDPSNLVVKLNGKNFKVIDFLTNPKVKGKNTFNLCKIKHKKSLKNGVYRLDLTRSASDCSGTATDNTSIEVTVAGNKIVKIGNASCPTTSNDTEDVPSPTPENPQGPTTTISTQGSILSIEDNANGATCPWNVDETGIRAILKPSNKILFTKKLLEKSFNLCGYDAGNKAESGKVYEVQFIRKVSNCKGTDQSTVNVNLTVDATGHINTVNGINCEDLNTIPDITPGPTPGTEVKGPTTDISAQGTTISVNDNANGSTCSWNTTATVVRATLQTQNTILFTREFPGTPQGTFELCGKTVNNQGIPGKVYPVTLTRQVKNCDGIARDSVNINISVNNNGYINTVNGVSCGSVAPDSQSGSNAALVPDSSIITDPIRDPNSESTEVKGPTTDISAQGTTISVNDNANGATCSWNPTATVVRGILLQNNTILFTREFQGTTFTMCGKSIGNFGEVGKTYSVKLIRQVKNCNGEDTSNVTIALTVDRNKNINSINGVSCGGRVNNDSGTSTSVLPDSNLGTNPVIMDDSGSNAALVPDSSIITDPIKTNSDQNTANQVGVTEPSFGQLRAGHARGLLNFSVMHGTKDGVKLTSFTEPPTLRIKDSLNMLTDGVVELEDNLNEVIPKNIEFKTPLGHERGYLLNLCRIFNNKFTQNTLYKNVTIEVSAKDLAGEALSSHSNFNGKKLMLSGYSTVLEGVKVTESSSGEKSFSLHNASGAKIIEYPCSEADSKFAWSYFTN
jgi:hypothetical protein